MNETTIPANVREAVIDYIKTSLDTDTASEGLIAHEHTFLISLSKAIDAIRAHRDAEATSVNKQPAPVAGTELKHCVLCGNLTPHNCMTTVSPNVHPTMYCHKCGSINSIAGVLTNHNCNLR